MWRRLASASRMAPSFRAASIFASPIQTPPPRRQPRPRRPLSSSEVEIGKGRPISSPGPCRGCCVCAKPHAQPRSEPLSDRPGDGGMGGVAGKPHLLILVLQLVELPVKTAMDEQLLVGTHLAQLSLVH